MNAIIIEYKKWWQTFVVCWSKHTAYRLNFLLQIIGPSLVFFFVKYNLWNAIYQGDTVTVIKGYDLNTMITYHLWAMMVGLLGQGFATQNLSEEIRLGKISSYLIYPFEFWSFHTASFLAFQFLQLIICSITIIILLITNLIDTSFITLIQGFLYCQVIALFWYSLQYMTGIMAFWLEETWILQVILRVITTFLSGAIIPLELYPQKLVEILEYTPFPYLTYYAIKVFMGQTELQFKMIYLLFFWILIFIFLNHIIWKKGIKNYTAAGM
jgi:ABC-2 type transport system permease protein